MIFVIILKKSRCKYIMYWYKKSGNLSLIFGDEELFRILIR